MKCIQETRENILSETGPRWYIWCPGCYEVWRNRLPDEPHRIWMRQSLHTLDSRWTYNGDYEHPTFRASVLVEYPTPKFTDRCHSFVTDGKIAYLPDCSHSMAGQTVDLLDVPDNYFAMIKEEGVSY